MSPALWAYVALGWFAFLALLLLVPRGRAFLAWAYEVRVGSYTMVAFVLSLVVISTLLRKHWALATATVVWLIVLALLYSGSLGAVSHVAAGAFTFSGIFNFGVLAYSVYLSNRERRRLYLALLEEIRTGPRDAAERLAYALGDAIGIAA